MKRLEIPVSRRSLLRGGAAAAALAALPSYDRAVSNPVSLVPAGQSSKVGANVRVSHDRYRVHVEPSLAANPRHPRQLLAACQASPTADPQFIATYLSFDGGASWQNGGLPPQPAAPRTVVDGRHGAGWQATRPSSRMSWRTSSGPACSPPRARAACRRR
jgi:hypothetical protein